MQPATIDLKSSTEPDDLNQMNAAFGDLTPGQTLIVQTAGNPRGLISRFMEVHWGEFDWALLREESGNCAASLTRRTSPGPSGLLEMMEADHRRCDELFSQAEDAAQQGDLPQAQTLYQQFALGMTRHFSMEEDGFFSSFDERMGSTGGGPVMVMREEHQQILGLMSRMGNALDNGDLEDYLGAADTLLYLMEQHNMKEEQMLYPMADDVFGEDREAIIKKMFLL